MKETTPSSKRIILGIDPGTTVMGYGLIAVDGKQMKLLHIDELVMNSKENHYLRLQKIFEKTIAIIDEFHPDSSQTRKKSLALLNKLLKNHSFQ